MRILKWILGIVMVLGLVFVGGAFLLPREVSVARSMAMEAAPDEVFPHINSLKAAAEWSPWMGIDPEMKAVYSGPDEGVGAKLAWTSDHPNVGDGAQEITASVPGERVETALDFGDMGTAKAMFVLAEAGEGTEVTWNFVADMGNNPIGRWMGLAMDGMVGADFEKGLNSLKTLVETN